MYMYMYNVHVMYMYIQCTSVLATCILYTLYYIHCVPILYTLHIYYIHCVTTCTCILYTLYYIHCVYTILVYLHCIHYIIYIVYLYCIHYIICIVYMVRGYCLSKYFHKHVYLYSPIEILTLSENIMILLLPLLDRNE